MKLKKSISLLVFVLASLLVGCSNTNTKYISAFGLSCDSEKTKYGYSVFSNDLDGQDIIISPQYEYALDFSDRLGCVRISDGKWAYIDEADSFVIKPFLCQEAMEFYDGVAAVKVDDKWGFIDKSGKFIIPPKYDEISFGIGVCPPPTINNPGFLYFYNGKAMAKIGDKWGLIDKNGRFVVRPEYDGDEIRKIWDEQK